MMRGSKQKLRQCAAILGLLYILLLDPAVVVSAPLSVNDMHPEGGCYYNLELYDHGEQIRTNEPCLNCTCSNHMLMCYLNTCPYSKPLGSDCEVERLDGQCCPSIKCPEVPVFIPDSQPFVAVGKPPTTTVSSIPSTTEVSLEVIGSAKQGCYFDEILYPEGHLLPSEDPCELCYCIRNHSACVIQNCTLQIPGCTPNYKQEACCPVSYDCETNLVTGTTTTSTVLPATGCYVDDVFHYDGSIINTGGLCQHCYCMKGEVICAVQECTAPKMDGCTAIIGEDRCCPFKYECPYTESPATVGIDVTVDDIVATAQPDWDVTVGDLDVREQETSSQAPTATTKPFYPLDPVLLQTSSQPPKIYDDQDVDESKITEVLKAATTESSKEEPAGVDIKDETLNATGEPAEVVEMKTDVQDESTTESTDDADASLTKEKTTLGVQATTEKILLLDAGNSTESLPFDDVPTTAIPAIREDETTSVHQHHGIESEYASTTKLPVINDELSYTPNTVPDDDIRDITEPSASFSGEPAAKFSPDLVETTSESPPTPAAAHTEAPADETTTEAHTKSQPQDSPTSSLPVVDDEIVTESGALQGVASTPAADVKDSEDKESEATDKPSPAPDRVNTEVSYTVGLHEGSVDPNSKPIFNQTVSESRVEPTTDPSKEDDSSDITEQSNDSFNATTVEHVSTIAVEVTPSPIPLSSPPQPQDVTETSPAITRLPVDIIPADEPKENETAVSVPAYSASSTTASPIEVVTEDGQSSEVPVHPVDPIVPTYPDEGNCQQDGITFNHGETVPSHDFCRLNCSCQSGLIQCQKIRCEIPELVKNLTCRELFEDGRCCPRYICGQTDTGHGIFTAESQVTLLPVSTSGDHGLKPDSVTTRLPGSTSSAPAIPSDVASTPESIDSVASISSQAPIVVSDEGVTPDYETGQETTAIPQKDDVGRETTTTVAPLKDEVEVEQETTVIPIKDEGEPVVTVAPQKEDEVEEQETTVIPRDEEVEQKSTTFAPPRDVVVQEITVFPLIPDEVGHETTISPPIDVDEVTQKTESVTGIPPLIALFDSTPPPPPSLKTENVTEIALTVDEGDIVQTTTDAVELFDPIQTTTKSSLTSPHDAPHGSGITVSDVGIESEQETSAAESTDSPPSYTQEPVSEKRTTDSNVSLEAVTPSVSVTDEPAIVVTDSPPPPPSSLGGEGVHTTGIPKLPVLDEAVTTGIPDAAEVTQSIEKKENVTQDDSWLVTSEPQLNLTAESEAITTAPQVNESRTDELPQQNVTVPSVTSSPARHTEATTLKPHFVEDEAANITEGSQENLVTAIPIQIDEDVNATKPLASNATELPIVKATTPLPVIKDDEVLATSKAPATVDYTPILDVRDKVSTSRPTTSTARTTQRIDDVTSTPTWTQAAIDKDEDVSKPVPAEDDRLYTTERPVEFEANHTKPDYHSNETKPEYSANETTTAKIPEEVSTARPQDVTYLPVKEAESTTKAATVVTQVPVEYNRSTSPDLQPGAETRSPVDERVTSPVTDESVTLTPVHQEVTTLDALLRNLTTPLPSSSSTLAAASHVSDQSTSHGGTLPSTTPSPGVDHHRINVTASTELLPHLPSTDFEEQLAGVSPDAGIPITSENFTLEEGQCIYESRIYSSAQQIPREDPCDFCFCFRGDIICLQQSCPPPINGCYEEAIPGFCCPRYECPVTAVTLNVTDPKTPPYPVTASRYRTVRALTQLQVIVCEFRNKFYNKGETIASASGPCMDCLCGEEGTMKCTPKKCQLDPLWQSLPNLRKVSTLGVTRLGRNRF